MNRKEVQLKIVLGTPETEDEDFLYRVTEEFQEELKKVDVEVEMPRGEQVKDAKGDPITIGTLLVTLISSGAITALINLLSNWIKSRKKNVEIKRYTKTPDGTVEEISIKITDANVDSNEIINFFKKLGKIFRKKKTPKQI